MPYRADYASAEPSPDEVGALAGCTVLEFGTPWCGHCIAAQPAVEAVLSDQPQARHIKVEDGPGRRLGRAFRVKLWPTLVFLRDGVERARVVRPVDPAPLRHALEALTDDTSEHPSP